VDSHSRRKNKDEHPTDKDLSVGTPLRRGWGTRSVGESTKWSWDASIPTHFAKTRNGWGTRPSAELEESAS